MKRLIIERFCLGEPIQEPALLGTYGKFWFQGEENAPRGFTVELPWRENARNHSCIPAGTYSALLHDSPKFGDSIWLRGVPNRSEILIHAGNSVQDFDGCIGPGASMGYWPDRETVAVWDSKATLGKILSHIEVDGGDSLLVDIRERRTEWK